jgi:hypothetical protein
MAKERAASENHRYSATGETSLIALERVCGWSYSDFLDIFCKREIFNLKFEQIDSRALVK